MTHLLAIDDNPRARATAGNVLSSASSAAAGGIVSFVRSWEKRVTANKYVRLASFSVVWTLANMTLVDISFDLAFNEQPYQLVNLFIAIL